MANVTPHLHHQDDANHTWTCEGTWHDSCEAEHHLRHFGSATEPVCWTLVGYASGIMSALFGERVIIKEVSCAAMGDQCCRYVGRSCLTGVRKLPRVAILPWNHSGPWDEVYIPVSRNKMRH